MSKMRVTALVNMVAIVGFALIPNLWLSTSTASDLKPTVTITSPTSGTVQRGKVTISGLAIPNPSGTSKIRSIGIKVVGLDPEAESYIPTGYRGGHYGYSYGIECEFDCDDGEPSPYDFDRDGKVEGTPPAAVWTLKESSNGKFSLTWDLSRWPSQTYIVTLFAKDSMLQAAASEPIQLIKEREPITTVNVKLTCQVRGSSYVDVATYIDCKSNVTLPQLSVQIQFNSGSGWMNTSIRDTFDYEFRGYRLMFKEGITKIRVTSPGLMEQYSPFLANTQYKPFTSNVVTVKTTKMKTSQVKVNKKSREYKTMFTVGQNFAKVSMATDSAMSQCKSAMNTGLIKVRGIPQYLGVQARQIQSYLRTPSGFQGCIDGFNS
ncbi:MAG: hypothetical protein FJW46_06255 [Actinobacteria bacterium]|nr:hypothetical protein [Actinomycetota bacterium]